MGPRKEEYEVYSGRWWGVIPLPPDSAEWNDFVLIGAVTDADLFMACPYPYLTMMGIPHGSAFLVARKDLSVWTEYSSNLRQEAISNDKLMDS